MLVEFVSLVDVVRYAVDFSVVCASRRSPLVSLRAPDYPYFTSREELWLPLKRSLPIGAGRCGPQHA
jgi:hypothetical protein